MLWNFIPLYGFCATVYSFTVDRHLSYLKLGAVTNKGIKNIYRQKKKRIYIGKFLYGRRLSTCLE